MLFIDSGSVSIVMEEFDNAEVLEFGAGLYVGETDLLLNNCIRFASALTRKHTWMSKTKCSLYLLKRTDFKTMMAVYKNELDEFAREAKKRQAH